MSSMRSMPLAVLFAVLASACTLDATGKDRCVVQADCLDGFTCLDGRCVGGSDGGPGERDAGAVETHAPLELVLPRALSSDAGVEPLSPAHRIFHAYPGLEYVIRPVVAGGAYPYAFTLSQAPMGMTIDSRTGELRWPDPRADALPVLTVRDAVGAEVTVRWPITVGEAAFKFVDAANGQPTGQGSRASPWRTLADVHTQGAAGQLVYFRSGTYSTAGIARESIGSEWERVTFNGRTHPVTFLAYPNERPVLDFGYQPGGDVGPLIRLAYGHPYVDGFETVNSHVIGFQVEGGEYAVFRRLFMHAHAGGPDGSSSSFIHSLEWDPPLYGLAIQDSEFSEALGGASQVMSGRRGLVIEDNHYHHQRSALALQDRTVGFTVRSNVFEHLSDVAVGGAMRTNTSGEVLFNLVLDAGGFALDLNQDGMAGQVHVFRNTFVGRVRLQNVSTTNGPFFLSHNVVVNDDAALSPPHFVYQAITDTSRIELGSNLVGAPAAGIVDGSGNLTSAFSSSRGTFGHER